MAAQDFTYTKISQLPAVTTLANTDIIPAVAAGKTSKITVSNLLKLFDTEIDNKLKTITNQLETLSNSLSTLQTDVSDLSGTVSNIITAGFNLIGTEGGE